MCKSIKSSIEYDYFEEETVNLKKLIVKNDATLSDDEKEKFNNIVDFLENESITDYAKWLIIQRLPLMYVLIKDKKKV